MHGIQNATSIKKKHEERVISLAVWTRACIPSCMLALHR